MNPTTIDKELSRLLGDFRYCVENNELARKFNNPPDVVEFYRGKAEAYREILSTLEKASENWNEREGGRIIHSFRAAAKRFRLKADNEACGLKQDYYDGCFEAYSHAAEWIEMVFPQTKVIDLKEWKEKRQKK